METYQNYKEICPSEKEMNKFLQSWLKENNLTVDDLNDINKTSDPEWESCSTNWDAIHSYKPEDDDYVLMTVINSNKEI